MSKGFQDTIAWYDLNADEYARASFSYTYQKEIDDFVTLLPKGGKVLDAGCGSGRDSRRLLDKGMKPTGIDISHGLITYAREHYRYIPFVEGDLRKLPFPDKSFNGVWAHASILHLETVSEVKTVIKEFHRVLTGGGILHISVKAQLGGEKTAIVSDSLSHHDRFFQYFKREELEGYLKEAGFEIVLTEQYREVERLQQGRPEVEWIVILGRKKG